MGKVKSVFGDTVVISGSEPFLVTRALDERLAQVRKERQDVEILTYDASELVDHPFTTLIGGSLFNPSTALVIDNVANAPADQLEQIQAQAISTDADLSLTLIHRGGQKGRAFFAELKKKKVKFIQATPIKDWKLAAFVLDEARRMGARIEQPAVQILIDAIGNDLTGLYAALRQLKDDAVSERIDANYVSQYFSGRADINQFAIAEAVLLGQSYVAMEKLAWGLRSQLAPVMVISALAHALRSIVSYRSAAAMLREDEKIADKIGIPVWKVKKIRQQAQMWTSPALAYAICALAQADAGVKGESVDAHYVCEKLIIDLERIRRHYR